MASVLLVFQLGQPRIWMSMSRDGLLPPKFSKLHKKYKTPAFSSVVAGFLVAIPTLFMNLTEVTDLTSIGTLFAFVLVSGGVLVLDNPKKPKQEGIGKGFSIPYFNSRYYLPLIWIGIITGVYLMNKEIFRSFLTADMNLEGQMLLQKVPLLLFIIVAIITSTFAIVNKFSLIPVLGLLTNFYLMSELGTTNWMRFLIWLVVGLSLYFVYGHKHSRLKNLQV
jgi:basic amino acid/polyamine antiporter, APA family